MDLGAVKAGLVSFSSALIASLCCLLPLAIVVLGLGSGAFMMVTMQYQNIFVPVGVIGVGTGYYLYFKEKRRCSSIGCSFIGRKTNLALLVLATVMVAGALLLNFFPGLTSDYLQIAM